MRTPKVRGPVTVLDAKTVLGMADPITVVDAARILRIRYAVTLRLAKIGKLKAKKLGARYFVEREDALQTLAAKPWPPYVLRLTPDGRRFQRPRIKEVRSV